MADRSSQGTLFGGAAVTAAERAALHERELQAGWADRTLELARSHPSALLVAATGSGKTPFAAMLARKACDGEFGFFDPANQPAFLFIAHTDELVTQAYQTFARLLPDLRVEIEQGESRADPAAQVVVGSRDSLAQPRRLERMGPHRFAVGCADEAHHYLLRNQKWWRIRNAFRCFWAGVTATPDLPDGSTLAQSFEAVIDYYSMLDAIEDGWLVPVAQRYEFMTGIDLDPAALPRGRDWTDAAVAEQVERESPLAAVARTAVKYGTMKTRYRDSRQVMVCCASVGQARKVAELINRWHRVSPAVGPAAAMHCGLDEKVRGGVDAAYKAGEIRYLCVYNIGLEGYDHDGIGAVVNARITTARYLVEQMAGRLVRPLKGVRQALSDAPDAAARRKIIAASDKPGGLFVDMTGTNHKLILGTAGLVDVLAGRPIIPHTPFDMDWVIQVKRKSLTADGIDDLAAELAAAQELSRAEKKRERERADAARVEAWAEARYRVKLASRDVNPFDLFDVRLYPAPAFQSKRGPTAGQYRALVNMGFDPELARKFTRGQARRMLDVIQARRRAGLCSYKQAHLLQKFGFDPNVSFDEASATLDTLAKNRWTRPAPPAPGAP